MVCLDVLNFHIIAIKNQINWYFVVSDLYISSGIHLEAPKRRLILKGGVYISIPPSLSSPPNTDL